MEVSIPNLKDLEILPSIKIKHFVLEYEVMMMFMNTEYSIHTYM